MKLHRLRQQLLTQDSDALLIFSDLNIRYLSDFSGHAATVLLTGKNSYLLTDYRYLEQAKAQAKDFTVICRQREKQSLASLIAELLQQEQCRQLMFESGHIDVNAWQQIENETRRLDTIKQIKAVTAAVEKLRYCKSEQEITAISQAAQIADQALANILPLVKEGITERELAIELEYQMALLGSEELSFATILLFGERSALPHGIPSNRKLKVGDLILVDFGAVMNGYRSDMTRTYVFGKASAEQKQVYQLVRDAQQAALDALKPGIKGSDLYRYSADILQASDYKNYAGEGLGHGVGLELHELPFIGPACGQKIEKGCVITIEPGIYIPGWGGIRIEDDVVLGPNGVEILTRAPKGLLEL
ncbi:M24 family metallopeptidase [Thalassomonas haliotis]|uniref:Aminopeptidase P family protein n=1 Tax=Thalassomonas haliotis TaxID=485448 RepID=A0ABY7VAH8_9GAMM|nr:Xaa-Pro peptidase family protein [Thalassomonas haliotis]WDE10074.1 aminopeptidase P family protein [Thalassomonas haliotis]